MTRSQTPVLDLPHRLSAKSDPALVAADERQLRAVTAALEHQVTVLTERLDTHRRTPVAAGQQALDRDREVHRLSADLRLLRRFAADLCLGRMVPEGGGAPIYIGRRGLTAPDGQRLLVDWRAPAAEPFFGATHATPMGLASRRRYRWSGGRVVDYWDEVFTDEGLQGHAALDDQSAFLASLGSSRSAQMRDVLGTIQSDQDAIIRAGSRGALVVDGGPGTGKTVVALHRAAYLLYADPHLQDQRGGILVIGPHHPYLDYVGDVLPSLGEEGVETCTLADLVPQGAGARDEADPELARLKESTDLVGAIETAVRFYEEPPADGTDVDTAWGAVWISPADWAEAFTGLAPGTPHNEAPEQIWEALAAILADQLEDAVAPEQLAGSLQRDEELVEVLHRAWPLIGAEDLVGDLWTVPAFLRHCAPWLTREQVRALQREDPGAWTTADLPLLDAARHRLGDPAGAGRRRREAARQAADEEVMSRVVEELIDADDSDLLEMTMLRGADLRAALVDESAAPSTPQDRLAGPFAHVIVDEAQELTDAQWQMVLRRCPSRSLTVVGDRAQSRRGFTEPWQERLERIGLDHIQLAGLTLNYRTPQEVMDEAEPVIRTVLPDANVPTSVRRSGVPVRHGETRELPAVVAEWLAAHEEGTACVIGAPEFPESSRVRVLSPEHVKGLEFDLVVLVDAGAEGADGAGAVVAGAVVAGADDTGVAAAVDRYVSMTRATQQLVVLTSG